MRWVWAASILYFLLSSSPLYCEQEPTPIEEGGECFEQDAVFISTESTRTPWAIAEVIAVPVGTQLPDQWEEYAAMKQSIIAQLPPSPDAAAFAQALVGVWQNYFEDHADVLVNLGRTISQTDTRLLCASGTWTYVSTTNSSVNDFSDWLPVGSGNFDINAGSSLSAITTGLTTILSTLNSQPGAQNEPETGQ